MAPLRGGGSLERGLRGGKQGFIGGDSDRFGRPRGEFKTHITRVNVGTPHVECNLLSLRGS